MAELTPCIEGSGKDNGTGYLQEKYKGKLVYGHRLAYCEAKGIPLAAIDGIVIRHQCDNTRCRNPEHLLAGTQQDNMDDKVSRNRQARGEAHGSAKLTAEQVATIRSTYVKYSRECGGPALAKRYGVDASLIQMIASGKGWNS